MNLNLEAFDTAQEAKEHQVKVLLTEPKAMAKQRLMDFAAGLPTDEQREWNETEHRYDIIQQGEPVTYTELIERATAFQTGGEYWNEGGRFEGAHIYDKFWEDFALVTEIPVTDNYSFFSCSC